MPQNRNNTCQERFLYNRERELRNLADFAKLFIVFTFFPRDVLERKSDLAKLSTESCAKFADFSPGCGGCKGTRLPCTHTGSQWARVRVEEERHGEKTNRDYKMLKNTFFPEKAPGSWRKMNSWGKMCMYHCQRQQTQRLFEKLKKDTRPSRADRKIQNSSRSHSPAFALLGKIWGKSD